MRSRGCRTALLIAVAVAAAVIPLTHATAKSDGFYYNKPGATLETLDADQRRCIDAAAGIGDGAQTAVGVGSTPKEAARNSAVAGLAVGAIAGIMAGADRNRGMVACMLVKGWRRVEMSESEVVKLRDAVERGGAPTMKELVGADPVTFGNITGVWENFYAQPQVIRGVKEQK